jgi:hypothetical protein
MGKKGQLGHFRVWLRNQSCERMGRHLWASPARTSDRKPNGCAPSHSDPHAFYLGPEKVRHKFSLLSVYPNTASFLGILSKYVSPLALPPPPPPPHTRTHTHMHTDARTHIHTHTRTHIHTAHIHTLPHTSTHTRTHTHTHTHIHTSLTHTAYNHTLTHKH